MALEESPSTVLKWDLAYALGYADPDAMMDEMTQEAWIGWQAYNDYSPVSLPKRLDYLFAQLAKTVADFSMSLDRKQYPQGIPMEDFLFGWAKPKPVQLTVEQSTQYLVEVASMYGAIDLRGEQ